MLLGALALSGSLFAAAPDTAQDPVDPAVPGDTPGSHQVSKEEADGAVAYWTPERMRNAEPIIAVAPEGLQSKMTHRSKGRSSVVDSRTVISEPVEAKLPPPPNLKLPPGATKTNGKLFVVWYENGKAKEGVCSAASVNSSSGRVLVTASHCLHTGGPDGFFMSFATFVPGQFVDKYDDVIHPFETFPAVTMHVSDAWVEHGDGFSGYDRDVAFASTDSNAYGKKLVDVAGGHGFAIGALQPFEAHVSGYPGTEDSFSAGTTEHDGRSQVVCQGRTVNQWWLPNHNYVGLPGCNLAEGASGAPILGSFDANTGLGFVQSVQSFVNPLLREDTVFGPLFDDEVRQLFLDASEWDGWVFP